MAINIIPLFLVMVGCVSVIYYAYNNIKQIKNKKLTRKEQRKLNKQNRAKNKHG